MDGIRDHSRTMADDACDELEDDQQRIAGASDQGYPVYLPFPFHHISGKLTL